MEQQDHRCGRIRMTVMTDEELAPSLDPNRDPGRHPGHLERHGIEGNDGLDRRLGDRRLTKQDVRWECP